MSSQKRLPFIILLIIIFTTAGIRIYNEYKIVKHTQEIAKIDKIISSEVTRYETLVRESTKLHSAENVSRIAKEELGFIDPKGDPNLVCYYELETSKGTNTSIKLIDFFTPKAYAATLNRQ
ncbi:MAG: hypothetical protein B6226_06240 [Candidatus Cloacimonetes bacterium 4572_65]|nr:MAG: hypothetical protein B6226_06240 [Candidatus Cloacimonetes bacterium 4572_65]